MEKVNLNFTNDNSVAQVILNDGKGNVLDQIMMREVQDVLQSLKNKPQVKIITFEGAGKHFSFGASVQEHKRDSAPEMLHAFHKLFFTLRDLSIPTLAIISGQCLGGGMELAIMCNFLFADKSAMLGQPEIVLGVFPPPASIILPEKIGLAKAEELLITGKTISATEAHHVGLINELYDDKNLLHEGVNNFIIKNILPKSASSLRYAVKASRVKFNKVLSENLLSLEQLYLEQLMKTNDANEGINSFLEKRTPVWQDC